MAVPSSGAVSIQDLVDEFGGSTPHSISEYYRGGSLVPDVSANNSVPTSGEIALTDFYGAVNAAFIEASGGSESTSGDYKIHTFNGNGTFTVNSVGNSAGSNTVEYLVIAGGGGGGYRQNAGGGGGSVNISFAGNVMSQDFIEDEAIPMIKEAIRRGADIGVA